jgi:hypothetical protein
LPRLPVDGKKVIEYRLTLGGKERELLDSLATSARIQSIDYNKLLEFLDDPTRIIQVMYSIATIAEILGIETGLPTAGDIPEIIEWFATRDVTGEQVAASGKRSLFDLLKDFLTGTGDFEGTLPGGY